MEIKGTTKKAKIKNAIKKIAYTRDVLIVPTAASLVITGQMLSAAGVVLMKGGFRLATLARSESIRNDAKKYVKGLNEVIKKSKEITDEINAKYAKQVNGVEIKPAQA